MLKKQSRKLLNNRISNLLKENNFLQEKVNDLSRQLNSEANKYFINIDGTFIKKNDIARVQFYEVDYEQNIKKPTVIIEYYLGRDIEEEVLSFESEKKYEEFCNDMNKLLASKVGKFGFENKVTYQKELTPVNDENNMKTKIETKVIKTEYM